MFIAVVEACHDIVSPPFRAVFWKVMGLTLALLALAWIALHKLLLLMVAGLTGWPATIAAFVAGLGLLLATFYLIAPVASIVAGFFLDDLAERVERATGAVGRMTPAGAALWYGLKFAVLALGVNMLALAVFLIPGVNVGVFIIANAYLLGRAYFEMAAMRFRSAAEAVSLRRGHRWRVFLCGLPIAIFAAIPVVNLLTPMFGIAYMVRIHRQIAALAPAPQPAS